MADKRELRVTDKTTGEVIRRIDVTGRSERDIDRITGGLLINMSPRYFVADSADEPTEGRGDD